MNYVIFNQDGSIREQAFGYYIQQGDNADTIFVSVEGFTNEYVCSAFLTLPTTETLLLAGAYQNNVEYKEGEFADGWVITLSGRATEFNGSVMCAIRLFLNNQIKLSYPLMLIVNETGYRPNEDTGITIEEINSYLQQLQAYQLKYDLHNVRYYSSYSDYQLDLVNLKSGQLAIVKEDENIFAYVDNGKIDFDYATKQYVEEIADTKLDKITSSGGTERVYGVDVGGNQKMFSTDRDYTLYKFENNLVKRFAGGQIALPLLPERDENAISKHYADLTYATKDFVANIYDILYDTIFVSAEEDFSGVNFIIPSTLTLEDNLPHDIVDKLPLTLKSVKGRTWIKNQLVNNSNWSITGGTFVEQDDALTITLSSTPTADYSTRIYQRIDFRASDIYLIKFGFYSSKTGDLSIDSNGKLTSTIVQYNTANTWQDYNLIISGISTGSDNYSIYPRLVQSGYIAGDTYQLRNMKLINLTKMFGAGREPATIEEFNNLTANIDLDTYDEGSFINVNITKIVSNGFNQFDGELELGSISGQGQPIESGGDIRTKNFIPVVCGKTYTLTWINADTSAGGKSTNIYEYDKNKQFIKRSEFYVYFTTPKETTLTDKTCFVKIVWWKDGITTSVPTDAQICFHLTHSGYRNGQYEPYVAPKTYTLTVSDLNGIGMAQDTITWDGRNRTETKVIGKIDLGTLSGVLYTQGKFLIPFVYGIEKIYGANPNILCSKYETTGCINVVDEMNDKTITLVKNEDYIMVCDSSYTDLATFKQSLQGVILYYELDIPTSTTTLEHPLEVEFEKGGYLTIDSGVWADIIAEFLVKDWSN